MLCDAHEFSHAKSTLQSDEPLFLRADALQLRWSPIGEVRNGGISARAAPRELASLMTRYFMPIPEASQPVIQAASMCKGGEIFVLDMSEPIKIVQLAEDLVALSGLLKGSIEFTFTGIRPGEKLYEELYFDDEASASTTHAKVHAAYASEFRGSDVRSKLDKLIAVADGDPDEVHAAIIRLIPSYQQTEASPINPHFTLQSQGAETNHA